MKLLAGTLLCVLLIPMAGCKPDAAVKRGAIIDAVPSHNDNGKAGEALPVPPQANKQPQAQTPPPIKVQ